MILEIILVLIVLAVAGVTVKTIHDHKANKNSVATSGSPADAEAAGKSLSGGHCSGTGSSKLSVSPMKAEDYAFIEPYGLMVGGHVTPVDHQYFSPTVFNSKPDTYEVHAMGDAKIVSIEVHPTRIRLVFSVSCTFFYYYDLLTSVEPNINEKALPIDVKAGQLIGHIGGQTLDFAVWDTTKPLTGFINPAHYTGEAWKIYTADPLNYYTDDLKKLALSKYVRTAEPRSGKIDYDIDGKLAGNWFQVGTNGYAGASGNAQPGYWDGHLAFAPDYIDPTVQIISIGYLAPANGQGINQFAVPSGSPDPNTIGANSGLVKFELKRGSYLKADGSRWDSMSYSSPIKLSTAGQATVGCALAQMTGDRQLKFETFMGASCASVSGFNNPRTYER